MRLAYPCSVQRMGMSASKQVEATLEGSLGFRSAVNSAFQECMELADHALPGLCAYQLLDASRMIYDKISLEENDPICSYREKWLPKAPTQEEVDYTIRKEGLFLGGKLTLDLESFHVFATTLFRDMGLTTARRRLAFYVPLSTLGVMCAHVAVQRLPVIGRMYKAGGPVMPGMLLGSIIGVAIALNSNLT